jgi:SpoVK/Ycf46/Vps4 family AAA+-type ATPase
VSEMFDKVLKMAHDDKELVCVLIDEIESIATSRQVSTKNGECTDTVRATNQLLTALDRIRNKPNIIVFCTSNLVDSIVRLAYSLPRPLPLTFVQGRGFP